MAQSSPAAVAAGAGGRWPGDGCGPNPFRRCRRAWTAVPRRDVLAVQSGDCNDPHSPQRCGFPRPAVPHGGKGLGIAGLPADPVRLLDSPCWWEFEQIIKIRRFAEMSTRGLAEAVRTLCAVPHDWNDRDLVLHAEPVGPLDAYRGRAVQPTEVLARRQRNGRTTTVGRSIGTIRVSSTACTTSNRRASNSPSSRATKIPIAAHCAWQRCRRCNEAAVSI